MSIARALREEPRRLAVSLALPFLLTTLSPAPAAGRTSREASREGAALLAAGDLAGARVRYLEAVSAEPRDFASLCELSRVESEMGEDASGEERRQLVAASVEHARAAVESAPGRAPGHLALAVALGRQALREGPRTRLALAREVKAEVDRALAIDPDLGRAYHVRGLWNRRIASLNFIERTAAGAVLGGVPRGASMANAVRDLEKAVELEPQYVNHHLELGRTYLQLRRETDARRALQQAMALPPTSSPRDTKYQAEARMLLDRLDP